MNIRPLIFHVNAFCGPDALGNPGAVCLLEKEHPAEWMQMIAEQMNLSETGFVRRDGSGGLSLRWFTPTKEVQLCGHVTLGAAHVLWNEVLWAETPTITFQTAAGPLVANRSDRGIRLRLPSNVCQPITPPGWLSDALGVSPVRVLGGDRKYLIDLESESEILRVRPDFTAIRHFADRGLIVTARSVRPEYDFVSRYFAGYVGVDEDPVTGSAHCCLFPYWSAVLGKGVLRARQVSKRGGELSGEVVGDGVYLTGEAQTVLQGYLRV